MKKSTSKSIARPIKGYKIFRVDSYKDFYCRNYVFGPKDKMINKHFEQAKYPNLCQSGFHFCVKLQDCFNYYQTLDKCDYVICEVKAHGRITTNKGDNKATNHLEIVRVLSWKEVFDILKVFISKSKQAQQVVFETLSGFNNLLWEASIDGATHNIVKKNNEINLKTIVLTVRRKFHVGLPTYKTFMSGETFDFERCCLRPDYQITRK